MWNLRDIKNLMLLSGIVGAMVGAMGVAMYVGFKELKSVKSNKGA
jgi:hypothetical protein